MTWKNIIVTKPSKLSYKNSSLVIKQAEQELVVHLKDIGIILLDDKEIIVTSYLLSKLADQGINLITVDSRHLPNGMFNSFATHNKVAYYSHLQVSIGKSLRKKIWQSLVTSKIKGQSLNLVKDSLLYDKFNILKKQVKSGDSGNVEAIAAKLYWSVLFKNFRRFDNDKHNILLNYGYSLIRSLIAKELVASGFYPPFGIFHHNQFNNYNLADDFIEPYRFLIERIVLSYLGDQVNSHDITVDSKDKERMFSVFKQKIILNNKEYLLSDAIKETVKSFQRVLKEKNHLLLMLP